MHRVGKKAINKELCQNDIQHVLFLSRWIFVQKYLPGNQHTVLAVKIYIVILIIQFNTSITVIKVQEKKICPVHIYKPETVKFLTLSV